MTNQPRIRYMAFRRDADETICEVGSTHRAAASDAATLWHGQPFFQTFDHPLQALRWPLADTRVVAVDLGGQVEDDRGDDITLSSEVTLLSDVSLLDIVQHATATHEQIMSVCQGHRTSTDLGIPATTAGSRANAATTAEKAHAVTTGFCAYATSAGDSAHAVTAGREANSATAGRGAIALTKRKGSNAVTAGYCADAATLDDGAHATTAGDRAGASTRGHHSHAATTGIEADAQADGANAIASTSGARASSRTAGVNAISSSLGRDGRACAAEGGWIVLAAYDDGGGLVAIRSSKVGENGIEAGVTYRLNGASEFERVAPGAPIIRAGG